MNNGQKIAAEIYQALIEVGEAVGAGRMHLTLRRQVVGGIPPDPADPPPTPWTAPNPWDNAPQPPQYFRLLGLDDVSKMRDANGTLIDKTVRTFTVDATGETPLKSDQIAVGLDQREGAEWFHIQEVIPVAPAGVALMYELQVEN